MRDKVYSHVGSLMGGVIHNLNTPLMWIMGRSQLIQARNENMERVRDMGPEEFLQFKEKNLKDIESIVQGADKIDQILKAISYKIQMATEGFTPLEIKEYLGNEVDFLMADMRFKHETKLEFNLEAARSHYVKIDYNALSWAVTHVIDTLISATEKGRRLIIGLGNGIITIACPQMQLTPEAQAQIEACCRPLGAAAVLHIDTAEGCTVSLGIKGS